MKYYMRLLLFKCISFGIWHIHLFILNLIYTHRVLTNLVRQLYICTRALHCFISFAHCCAASTAGPLPPTATFMPSLQPDLGLPFISPPLTSAINTLLALQYSSILSTCPNHLNTLWSALLAAPTPLYTSSPTHLIISNSIHSWHSNQTSQTLHLKNINFPSRSTSHTPCLCSVQCSWYNYSCI